MLFSNLNSSHGTCSDLLFSATPPPYLHYFTQLKLDGDVCQPSHGSERQSSCIQSNITWCVEAPVYFLPKHGTLNSPVLGTLLMETPSAAPCGPAGTSVLYPAQNKVHLCVGKCWSSDNMRTMTILNKYCKVVAFFFPYCSNFYKRTFAVISSTWCASPSPLVRLSKIKDRPHGRSRGHPLTNI